MKTRIAGFALWLSWIMVIIAVVAPWGDFQGHTHWGKVTWVPFTDRRVRVFDLVGNVVLYVPFGYLLARTFGGRHLVRTVVVLAAALSIATEFTQVFSHWRFPSATDVTCNVCGAWCGWRVARAKSWVAARALAIPQESSK